MLIYEKNNKLNINFDNEISENPDIQIGKDGDKTEVLVDGSSNPTIPVPVLPEDVGKAIVVNEDGSYALATPSGGSNLFVVSLRKEGEAGAEDIFADKTASEIYDAFIAGKQIVVYLSNYYYPPMYICVTNEQLDSCIFGYNTGDYGRMFTYSGGRWRQTNIG